MKVNKLTLNIDHFGSIDIQKLKSNVDILVYEGKVTEYIREVFEEWASQAKIDIDGSNGLLLMSTVFPIRIYSSLLERWI